ncbi:hypothetical protein JW926_13170 [Candidatus Sumerlaeota bacterium]|nr:hypothetical protein [Candidatus Sumerlaeota bacterium]
MKKKIFAFVALAVLTCLAFAQEAKKPAAKAARESQKKEAKLSLEKRIEESFADAKSKMQDSENALNQGILEVVKNLKFNLSKDPDPRIQKLFSIEIEELVKEQKRMEEEYNKSKKKMDELINRATRKALVELEIFKMDNQVKKEGVNMIPERLYELGLNAEMIANNPKYNLSPEDKANLLKLAKEKETVQRKAEKCDKDSLEAPSDLMTPLLKIIENK